MMNLFICSYRKTQHCRDGAGNTVKTCVQFPEFRKKKKTPMIAVARVTETGRYLGLAGQPAKLLWETRWKTLEE